MHDVNVLADSVRDACIDAAIRAYEHAGISGLCAKGRWELAIQAMREMDLQPAIASALEGKNVYHF